MDLARDPKDFGRHFEVDYFDRAGPMRNWKTRLSLWLFILGLGTVIALIAMPRWHTAFQAAPVTHVHAKFGTQCNACHDEKFATASRLLPGYSNASSVSDTKCLECHKVGHHNPHQMKHSGEGGLAAGCTDCHKEHREDRLTLLADATCTQCHADLKTRDGYRNYHQNISHFAEGHPEFGEWRKQKLTDPAGGKFKFNHEAHLNLPKTLPGRSETINAELSRLKSQDCAYCHQTDWSGQRMKPVTYEQHCKNCHPIDVQPPGEWPADVVKQFSGLAHPGIGGSADSIRATLLERFIRLAVKEVNAKEVKPINPTILRPADDPKVFSDIERVALKRTKQAEEQLWGKTGVGCLLCHETTGSVDGVPTIAATHQQMTRWNGLERDWPADRLREPAYADERNRWFPLAYFDHRSHRTLECTKCHDVRNSKSTADVLMPNRQTCLECHGKNTNVRSDCLTCHKYHDRSRERSVASPGVAHHE